MKLLNTLQKTLILFYVALIAITLIPFIYNMIFNNLTINIL